MGISDLVQRGVSRSPLRVLLYGTEGIGKTTWAAGAPGAVFIGTEDGYGDIDVTRLPAPKSWRDVVDYVRGLRDDPHDFATLVVDTIDHLESLVWSHVCKENGWSSIEDAGYGKGYTRASEVMADFARDLDDLRAKRGMQIVLLCHAKIETYKNPEGPDYDRFTLKCHKAVSALFREWCDVVLFARLDVSVKSNERGDKALLRKGKALDTSERVVMTTTCPAYDAKNRFHLPEELPMTWAAFAAAAKIPAPRKREIDPSQPWPSRCATLAEIDANLAARGWTEEAERAIGKPRASWTGADGNALMAFGRKHAPWGERPASATAADDAGTLLDKRRAKRVREATDAGVLDAIVTQYGEPMTWTHDTVNAIKADLAKLTEAA